MKTEVVCVESMLSLGCSLDYKRLSVCDLSKNYYGHISRRKYQVDYDSSDKKISYIYEDAHEAAKEFVRIRREIV